jgi:hypothetical protein
MSTIKNAPQGGLLGKIKETKLGYGGEKPTYRADNTKLSPLHYRYSIDGEPKLTGYPSPSQLDLGGITPKRYLDNPPK